MEKPRNLVKKFRSLARGSGGQSRSASLSHLGITYAAAIIVYGLGGWWLDKKLGCLPLFTMVGVALGAVGGFIWIYREVMRAQAREDEEKKRRKAEEKESP